MTSLTRGSWGREAEWSVGGSPDTGIKGGLLVPGQRVLHYGLFHSGVVHRKALLCLLHHRATPTQTAAKFHNTHTSWVCWSSDAILNLEKEGVLWENIPQSQCRVLFGVEGCCCSFFVVIFYFGFGFGWDWSQCVPPFQSFEHYFIKVISPIRSFERKKKKKKGDMEKGRNKQTMVRCL